MRVTRYAVGDAERKEGWQSSEEGFGGSDLIDEATHPEAEMTVGFARVVASERMTAAFPYDEVMVVLKGSVRVKPEHGHPVTACQGDIVYLPANSTSTYEFYEDFEAAYVASPPSVYAQHVIDTGHG